MSVLSGRHIVSVGTGFFRRFSVTRIGIGEIHPAFPFLFSVRRYTYTTISRHFTRRAAEQRCHLENGKRGFTS